MADDGKKAGKPAPARRRSPAWRRLRAARLPLAVLAVALVAGIWFGWILPWFALAVFAVVAVAAALQREDRSAVDNAARRIASRRPKIKGTMRRVVTALPAPAFLLDHNGIVRFTNAAAREDFPAVKTGEALARTLRDPTLTAMVERVGQGLPAEKILYTDRSPTERWYMAYLTPVSKVSSDAGKPNAPEVMLLMFEDLTEQKLTERMRADFIANASHELRTPLASLSGFIETLQGPARDDPDARERFLGVMQEQASRMSRLINDLLSLSRIEMRQHQRPPNIIDLSDVIDHVVDSLKPVAEEEKVELHVSLPAEREMLIRGEFDELAQVFSNLIENALKYGAEGGRVDVDVGAETEGDRTVYTVSVRDYGPGIATEHLPRLTERFYRVDVTDSRQKKGTGLGLAIVKHIVNRHRGRLSIDSQPGQGATFTVRLDSADENK